MIEDQGADLNSKSNLERIQLGASIKLKLSKEKLTEALVGTVDFHLEASKVNGLREKISQKKEVLRLMIIKKEEKPEEPQTEPKSEEEDKKVELEDIDQKLDEILEE